MPVERALPSQLIQRRPDDLGAREQQIVRLDAPDEVEDVSGVRIGAVDMRMVRSDVAHATRRPTSGNAP